ncbi:MAG: 4-hydroxythreonine-4-phosphate dehydrogenase PdxA [Candidatus Omnitrophica bacterium]|nr:4-hydroxythreonine-4-phosphate dehydrogenase PdxA [Candidatus Omnitrophota bacterium]
MDAKPQAYRLHFHPVKRVPVIAITMGDPGGIGPEIIVKTLLKEKPGPSCAFLVVGVREPFERVRERCGLSVSLRDVRDSDGETLKGGFSYFWDISGEIPKGGRFRTGKIDGVNGAMALAVLEKTAGLAERGIVNAIVTAPVNKAAVRLADPSFIGHTEYFASRSRVKDFAMMFLSSRLKVTLATIHVPLRKVSSLLTAPNVFKKILMTDAVLRRGCGIKKPRIAVCALNPHGRETGEEEDRKIAPAVRRAKRRGVNATGPFSADQLFHAAYAGHYDAVISMYHDQALGPFKMVAFHEGVNMTLGLPYVRTSPDHGTAFDIAYGGKADPSSMRAALRLARDLALTRYAHSN